MIIDRVHLLILNFNGQALLKECLPTIVDAAKNCRVPCRVTVVDNGSEDNSCEWMRQTWPMVGLIQEQNAGLASFNKVLARLDEPVVFLLNNDVKLEPNSLDPLLTPFEQVPDALFSAPLCWTFDGLEYEGMRTRVRTRYGLVQGLSRVPGFEEQIHQADLTAAAGPILAVDRKKFLALGGYDPIYFPGRIEDLDLGFRAWISGYKGYYVPESVAYHRGFGSFEPAFGRKGCDRLAARNTLIFSWKNLRGLRLANHLAWIPARFLYSVLFGRFDFAIAFFAAVSRLRQIAASRRLLAAGQGDWVARQESFFQRFRW